MSSPTSHHRNLAHGGQLWEQEGEPDELWGSHGRGGSATEPVGFCSAGMGNHRKVSVGGGGQVEAQPELSRRELTEAPTRVAAEKTSGVDRSELPG